jgi:hypothetical protein
MCMCQRWQQRYRGRDGVRMQAGAWAGVPRGQTQHANGHAISTRGVRPGGQANRQGGKGAGGL